MTEPERYCENCKQMLSIDLFTMYIPGYFRSVCSPCRGGKPPHPRPARSKKIKMPDGYKPCKKCERILPSTSDYFPQHSKYLLNKCLECIAEEKRLAKEQRKANRQPRKRSYTPGTIKVCSKCGIGYPATKEFFAPLKGGLYDTRPDCRQCRRKSTPEEFAQKKELAKTRAEHTAKTRQKTAERLDLKRKGCKQCCDCKAVLPETESHFQISKKTGRSYSRCRQCASVQSCRYLKAHPEKGQVHNTRRMARKRNLPATFTDKDWLHCLEYFNHSCAVCGRPNGLWHKMAQDHWIPLSNPECPGTVATNIVPLCHGQGGCNNYKTSHNAAEWLTEKFGARKAKQIIKRIETYFASLTNG